MDFSAVFRKQETHHGSHAAYTNHANLTLLGQRKFSDAFQMLAFLIATFLVASSIFSATDSCFDIVIGRNNLIVVHSEVTLLNLDQARQNLNKTKFDNSRVST